ncbi:MAG: hypothetical protein OEW00_01180 [candidate division Zixibacteria bacterium]|nr:hypothetical protein [candidate division Zixibacteria bacterium]
MVDPIEVPDYSSKPPTTDKLKPVVRSDPEKDRNGFSKALKEKMEEELEEKKRKSKDRLEIGEDDSEHKHDASQQHPPSDESGPADADEAADAGEPGEHVDLKA